MVYFRMDDVCLFYCGVTCVDGHCPLIDSSICCDFDVKSCCIYYKGCDDCAFWGTDLCGKK